MLGRKAVAVLATFFATVVGAVGTGQPCAVAKAEAVSDSDARVAIEQWLKLLSEGPIAVSPKVTRIDDSVSQVFDGDRFYAIRFMRYPRAVKPPDSLKLENVVCVRANRSVIRIENIDWRRRLIFNPNGKTKAAVWSNRKLGDGDECHGPLGCAHSQADQHRYWIRSGTPSTEGIYVTNHVTTN